MNNNDILKQLRYTFDFNDAQMIEIFALADREVTRSEVSNWLKKEDDPLFDDLYDKSLATYLNGLINLKRSKREGEQPIPEKRLTNNLILWKLKIALNLKDVDMLEILALAGLRLSKTELTALFRKPTHQHYRMCKDQILRNFLYGLKLKYRED